VNCCPGSGCDQLFNESKARRDARRYRRKGLDSSGGRIVEFLRDHIAGRSVLEVGGGIGGIQLELLKAGADRATSVELSPGYEHEAEALLAESGLQQRVARSLLDFAVDGDRVAAADVVVLNRVVCCYPDYRRMLAKAADHARSTVVFSNPRRNPLSRFVVWASNASMAMRRRDFRAYVHQPAAMVAVLTDRGFQPVLERRGMIWEVRALQRPDAVTAP
jgi:2-polyprenyl-3-methyl-5-hydroxy-6-metoxy-1,4-benzoquinol methylase